MDAPNFLNCVNPATGVQFDQLAMSTPEEVNLALRGLREVSKEWGKKPVQERIRILRKFQKMMLDSLDEITEILSQDCGKSRQDALIEVFITVDMLDMYCKRAPGWLRREAVSPGLYLFKRCYVEHRPFGVVGIIAPWNYPFALSMIPAVAALIAGNTVIMKPSEVTAATGRIMEKLFERVPELACAVRVIHGDGSVGEAMVKAKPDYIFLTGSTPTGRKVMKTAADDLIPVACELGGKDSLLVLEDADLQAAAHWGVWGAFFNTGQTCMAVERVYVVEQVYEEFVRLAVEETQKLKIGYTGDLESPYYLGPVTDPRQLKIIQNQLEDALEKGARILCGGQVQDMFVTPTVLVEVDHNMLVMREETFGPLMPIMKVKDQDEAVTLINDCIYGLGASIWSADLKRAQEVAHQIEASSIIINDTIAQFAIPMLPFGGIKLSGYARVHGKEGLMQFTRPYAYVVGNPPLPFDLATVLRRPGHYRIGAAVMRLAFGVTPGQRLQPIVEEVKRQTGKKNQRLALGIGLLGSAATLIGAAASLALVMKQKRNRKK